MKRLGKKKRSRRQNRSQPTLHHHPPSQSDAANYERVITTSQKRATAVLTIVLSASIAVFLSEIPSPFGWMLALVASVMAGVWYLGAFLRPHLKSMHGQSVVDFKMPAGLRESVPNFFSLLRIPTGLLVTILLVMGYYSAACWFYLFGMLTDVADGFLARRLRSTTAWGKGFDAYMDATFNSLTGLGIVWVSVYPAIDWERLVPLAINLGLFIAVTTPARHGKIAPGFPVAKYLSGVFRVVLFGLLISLMPSPHRLLTAIVGGILLVAAGSYEVIEMRRQRRNDTSRHRGAA